LCVLWRYFVLYFIILLLHVRRKNTFLLLRFRHFRSKASERTQYFYNLLIQFSILSVNFLSKIERRPGFRILKSRRTHTHTHTHTHKHAIWCNDSQKQLTGLSHMLQMFDPREAHTTRIVANFYRVRVISKNDRSPCQYHCVKISYSINGITPTLHNLCCW